MQDRNISIQTERNLFKTSCKIILNWTSLNIYLELQHTFSTYNFRFLSKDFCLGRHYIQELGKKWFLLSSAGSYGIASQQLSSRFSNNGCFESNLAIGKCCLWLQKCFYLYTSLTRKHGWWRLGSGPFLCWPPDSNSHPAEDCLAWLSCPFKQLVKNKLLTFHLKYRIT